MSKHDFNHGPELLYYYTSFTGDPAQAESK